MDFPINGSCQCGKVRYQLLAEPLMVIACHCKQCQKLSTSAFSITAVVNADAIRFSGELKHWQRSSDSGRINAAKFCPECGNRIYHYDPDKPEQIKLKPSTLENTDWLVPSAHVWTSAKQAWYQIPAGVKSWPQQPE